MRRQTMIAILSVLPTFTAVHALAQNTLLDAKIPREAESSSSGLLHSVSPIAGAKKAKATRQATSQEAAAARSAVAPRASVPKLMLAPTKK